MTDVERAIARMEAFADRMCTCIDKSCADGVQDEMTRWGVEQASHARDDVKHRRITEEETKRMASVAQRYGDCMLAAMGANPCAGP